MDSLPLFIELIPPLLSIPVSIIAIIEFLLKRKENREKEHLANIINNRGVLNGDIHQTINFPTTVTTVKKRVKTIEAKQEDLETICKYIRKAFSLTIVVVFILIALNNITQNWGEESHILDNTKMVSISLYEAFGTMIKVIIPLLFLLSLILLTKSIVYKQNLGKTIMTFITLTVANVMNWMLFSTYSLGNQVDKLLEQNSIEIESLSLEKILEIPFILIMILIILIIASWCIANYLLQVTLTGINFQLKLKIDFTIAILFYLGIPTLIFYIQ